MDWCKLETGSSFFFCTELYVCLACVTGYKILPKVFTLQFHADHKKPCEVRWEPLTCNAGRKPERGSCVLPPDRQGKVTTGVKIKDLLLYLL